MARILHVDDDEAIRKVVHRQLVRAGHEVMQASNGQKALDLLRSETFDLLITDFVMPDMDGLQLIRESQKLPQPPKIIAMSGGGRGSADDYLEFAKRFGAAITLEKPARAEEILAAITQVLGS